MKSKKIEVGKKYRISGDLENGYRNGTPYICHDEVSRVVKRVTDEYVICECDRKFLNNQNLTFELCY